MMTNSAKYAHYAPGLLGVQSVFGSTEACVESAVAGRVIAEDGPWHDVIRLEAAAVIVAGAASGTALAADEPLSFWGGLDPNTGEIIDRRHPLSGERVSGRVLVIPSGRGSCSASGVFLEAIRNRTAPSAVIVSRIDPIIGLGSILGDELYAAPVPVLVLAEADRALIHGGDHVQIDDEGKISVQPFPTGPLEARGRDESRPMALAL